MRFTCAHGVIHSRSGKAYDGAEPLAKAFPNVPFVFDGELWVDDGTGKPMPRSKGNGIITKALKGTITEAEAALINCTVWDIIPLADWEAGECKIPYSLRLQALNDVLRDEVRDPKIHVVETHIVQNFDEVNALFATSLEAGEEGVMVKALHEPWTNDRVKHQIKYKAERTADLRCRGWGYGTGKYAGKIGWLELETEDQEIVVKVGSGLSDADREKDGAYYLDRIIEITYNERIKARSDKKESLFLPRYECVRFDKEKANYAHELS
jgi:ATP-dependent DNA ligase